MVAIVEVEVEVEVIGDGWRKVSIVKRQAIRGGGIEDVEGVVISSFFFSAGEGGVGFVWWR